MGYLQDKWREETGGIGRGGVSTRSSIDTDNDGQTPGTRLPGSRDRQIYSGEEW